MCFEIAVGLEELTSLHELRLFGDIHDTEQGSAHSGRRPACYTGTSKVPPKNQ